jgi:hypothetical protein
MTVSLNTMIKQIAALQGTPDVTPWEEGFINSVVAWSKNGENTTTITPRQADTIERLWSKHLS